MTKSKTVTATEAQPVLPAEPTDASNALKTDLDFDALPLDRFFTYQLNVLSNMLNRHIERFLNKNFGISLPAWRVLAILGQFRALSVRDVAARSQMDKALVSRTISRLVTERLVDRHADPNDARLLVLSLTPSGEALYETIMPMARRRQQRLLDSLEAGEQRTLRAALEKLTHVVRENDARSGEEIDRLWY